MSPIKFKSISLAGTNVNDNLGFIYTGNGEKSIAVRTAPWGDEIRHTVNIDFGSVTNMNNYFQTNGEIRFSGELENPSLAPDYVLQKMLDRLGVVAVSLDNTQIYGYGYSSGIGINQLTDFDQDLCAVTDDVPVNVDPRPIVNYGTFLYTISGRKLSSYVLRFTVSFDFYDNNKPENDIVTGTLSSYIDEKRYISLDSPTYTTTSSL